MTLYYETNICICKTQETVACNSNSRSGSVCNPVRPWCLNCAVWYLMHSFIVDIAYHCNCFQSCWLSWHSFSCCVCLCVSLKPVGPYSRRGWISNCRWSVVRLWDGKTARSTSSTSSARPYDTLRPLQWLWSWSCPPPLSDARFQPCKLFTRHLYTLVNSSFAGAVFWSNLDECKNMSVCVENCFSWDWICSHDMLNSRFCLCERFSMISLCSLLCC